MRKKKRMVSKDVMRECVARTAAELLEVRVGSGSLLLEVPAGSAEDVRVVMGAVREARERVKGLYRMGICGRCSGPANRCAPRHAEGRSCA